MIESIEPKTDAFYYELSPHFSARVDTIINLTAELSEEKQQFICGMLRKLLDGQITQITYTEDPQENYNITHTLKF